MSFIGTVFFILVLVSVFSVLAHQSRNENYYENQKRNSRGLGRG